jgi:hypothetical protein
MRCDLHVHSWHSGKADAPLLRHVGRECYSDPLEAYARARARGMDLLTLTDHDTIDGAQRLAHLPDTFVRVELTVRLEAGRQLHVNVLDLDERQHAGLQRRAADPKALFAFLAEERVPASVRRRRRSCSPARPLRYGWPRARRSCRSSPSRFTFTRSPLPRAGAGR